MSKPALVKTFKDVEKLMGSCRVVINAFNTCYNISLKNWKQSRCLGDAAPVKFTVDDAFDISDVSLKEMLSQPLLSSFFAKKLHMYVEQNNIGSVLAENGSTVMS